MDEYRESYSVGSLRVFESKTTTRIFQSIFPEEFYQKTGWLPLQRTDRLEYIEPTCGTRAPEGTQVLELQSLRSQSGLAWKQIAVLFDVDVRMVHYWLSGERAMLQSHKDVMVQVLRLLSILNCGPSHKTRRFLEDQFLSNQTLITLLKKRDFLALDSWAQRNKLSASPTRLPISASSLQSRLPSRPAFGSLAESEELNSGAAPKARLAKIRRNRKRP